MKDHNIKLANLLTYSGTLPFIGCAIAMKLPSIITNVNFIASAYGAVIISFLCGIHWGIYLFFSSRCSRNLLISSNFIALVAWSLLIIPFHSLCFLIQVLCFIYLLIIDIKLRDAAVLPEWFYRLRRNATIIVVSCLCFMMRFT